MSYKLIFGPLEKLILGGIIALKVAIYRRLGKRRIVYKKIEKRVTFRVFALCPAQTIVLERSCMLCGLGLGRQQEQITRIEAIANVMLYRSGFAPVLNGLREPWRNCFYSRP